MRGFRERNWKGLRQSREGAEARAFENDEGPEGCPMTDHPERPPFERHRTYYMILKFAVLIAAVLLALRYFVPWVVS